MSLTDWVCAIAGALATGLIAWSLIPWSRQYQLVDRPSGRHDHAAPTPVVGGLAIFFSVACIGLARGGGGSAGFLAFLAAAALLVVVGVLDDLRDLSWRLRVPMQALAAVILFAGGAYASNVGNLLNLGLWSLPFSIFATVGVINAVNMIDGSDGLAGSLMAVALGFFVFEAVQAGDHTLAAQLLLLLGSVLGFLALNLRFKGQPAARIFLGNSGSALLGLCIAWAAFRLARQPGHASAGILAPWVLAIPLIDCVVLMGRRMLRGGSPFRADRNHIHHLMRDAGYSPQRIVGIAVIVSILAGFAADAWLRRGWPELPLVLIFLGLIAAHFAWSARRERAVALLQRKPVSVATAPTAYAPSGEPAALPRSFHD